MIKTIHRDNFIQFKTVPLVFCAGGLGIMRCGTRGGFPVGERGTRNRNEDDDALSAPKERSNGDDHVAAILSVYRARGALYSCPTSVPAPLKPRIIL